MDWRGGRGALVGITDASVEEAVYALTCRRLATETSGNEVEFVLIDEVGEARYLHAAMRGRAIQEIRGEGGGEAEEFAVVCCTDRVQGVKLLKGPAGVLAYKPKAGENTRPSDL